VVFAQQQIKLLCRVDLLHLQREQHDGAQGFRAFDQQFLRLVDEFVEYLQRVGVAAGFGVGRK